jgi:hypothetical protein
MKMEHKTGLKKFEYHYVNVTDVLLIHTGNHYETYSLHIFVKHWE